MLWSRADAFIVPVLALSLSFISNKHVLLMKSVFVHLRMLSSVLWVKEDFSKDPKIPKELCTDNKSTKFCWERIWCKLRLTETVLYLTELSENVEVILNFQSQIQSRFFSNRMVQRFWVYACSVSFINAVNISRPHLSVLNEKDKYQVCSGNICAAPLFIDIWKFVI